MSKRLILIAIIAVLAGVATYKYVSNSEERYTCGIVSWVGYGPLIVADELGMFEKAGYPIDIKVMDQSGERVAAYNAGHLDFFPNTPDAFVVQFAENPLKGKIFAVLNESKGADGLIATADIESVADLKGKDVGFQAGITSHFFLLYLLRQEGLKGSDVVQKSLSAGDAGTAFKAGSLDAAVTWEPWLTIAADREESRLLATSADTPGLIADIVLASERAVERPDLIKGFMDVWFDAVDYMRNNPEESYRLISKRFSSLSVEHIAAMIPKAHFYTLQESEDYLIGNLHSVLQSASTLYIDNKVIRKVPNLAPMIKPELARGESVAD